MNRLIRFDLAFHGQDRNQHDQRFGKIKGAAAGAITLRFGKLRDPQKLREFILELFDPFGIQFRNGGQRRFCVHAPSLS